MFKLRKSSDFEAIGIAQDARMPAGSPDPEGLVSHFSPEML